MGIRTYVPDILCFATSTNFYAVFNNKILTSARSGELIMWDINKSGGTKYGASPHSIVSIAHLKSHVERRSKDHIRSINRLSVSRVVHYYCITGSADGDMRIWVSRSTSLVGDKNTDTSPGSERSLKVCHKSATFNIHSKHCLFTMRMATTTSHCGLG